MTKKILFFFLSITLLLTGCTSSDELDEKPKDPDTEQKEEIKENENNKENDDDKEIEDDNITTGEINNGSTGEINSGSSSNGNSGSTGSGSTNPGTSNKPSTTKYGSAILKYVDEYMVPIKADTTNNVEVGKTSTYNAPALAGYSIQNKSESVVIAKENEKKEITFNYVKNDSLPYISTYFIKPTVQTGEEVKIKFYVTDYQQKEYRDDDNTRDFKITIKVDGKNDIVKTVKSGTHEISIGSFESEQKIDFSIQATDVYGRNSHRLYNYFRVHNGTQVNQYNMTTDDLATYGIKNSDTYAVRKYVDVTAIDDSSITTMTQAYNNESPASNTYTVLIPRVDNNTVGKKYYRYTRVKYASNYDKDKVLAEAKKTREGLQRFIDDKKAQGYNYIKFLPGTYRIDHERAITIPSNMTIDMNSSKLKMNQFTGSGAVMIAINNASDARLTNGIIEGDYYEHDYAGSPNNSEWVHGIALMGNSEYSSMDNLEVRDITGYGVINGMSLNGYGEGYTYYSPKGIGGWKFGDINRANGNDLEDSSRLSSDYFDISYATSKIPYIAISKYLGYQGRIGNTWNLIVHFYDENKKIIESVDSYQYRRIKAPTNAKYIRVTLLEATGMNPTDANQLSLAYFRVPTNSKFSNILIDNARCVGLAPAQMNNMLFEDIEFTRNGQSGANCAFDAEDGWDGMQDATFRRLNFHDNAANDFLTCAGHNFIVEDMVQGKIYMWGRTNSSVIENNKSGNINIIRVYANSRTRTGYYRIQDNNLRGIFIAEEGSYDTNWRLVVKNTTFTGGASMSMERAENGYYWSKMSGEFRNCTFDLNNTNSLQKGYYVNSTINNPKGENHGGIHVNSKIEGMTGNLHNIWQFENSTINNTTVNTGGYDPHLIASNTKFNNVSIHATYWSGGIGLDIKNSEINNNESFFLRSPHYSTKYEQFINNNKITLGGTEGLIKYYDDREYGDYDRKSLTLTNNKIAAPNSTYLITGLTNKTTNKLHFITQGNDFGNLKILEPNVESYANITLTQKKGGINYEKNYNFINLFFATNWMWQKRRKTNKC